MAMTARYKKQVPTDVWSTRERLALASSVLRSGDQNWVSVSRAIKPYGEANRPADWFSQKNCALQYTDLLEKVETPKRKRADRGEVETPGNQIMRKLTIERIEELKQLVQEEQQKYKKLKTEIEAVKAGQVDNKIKEVWEEMQREKKAAEEAAAKKAADEAQARLEAQAKAAAGRLMITPKSTKKPDLKLKMGMESGDDSTQDSLTDIEVKVEDDSGNSNQSASSISTPQAIGNQLEVKARATPPSSPLLSSLLQNKHELQKLQAQQQQQLLVKQTTPTMPGDASLLQQPKNPEDKNIFTAVQIKVEGTENTQTSQSGSTLVSTASTLPSKPAILGSVSTTKTTSSSTVVVTSSGQVVAPAVVAAATTKCDVPSSPSAGAPTLSRLLVIPPVTGSAPIKINTNQSSAPAQQAPQAKPTEAQTSKSTTESSDSKGSDSTIITTSARPSRRESDRLKEDRPEAELSGGRASVVGDDEPPASPASSVVSNETDSGSTKGKASYGAKKGRVSTGGKAKITPGNSRRTSGRITRRQIEEEKKDEGESKPSEAESSDDETIHESDDAASTLTPARQGSHLSESVPNSPASASHSDTEDEKAYKLWKKSIMLVWRAAANHKYANVFLHPVTNEIAPGYRAVVHRPMDLSTIKKNIEAGMTRTTQEFQRDTMLMFTNAIMYNNSDHDVYNMAQEMYDDVMTHIYQYQNTQMTIQTETKSLRPSRRSEAFLSDKEEDLRKRKVAEESGGKTKKRKI